MKPEKKKSILSLEKKIDFGWLTTKRVFDTYVSMRVHHDRKEYGKKEKKSLDSKSSETTESGVIFGFAFFYKKLF